MKKYITLIRQFIDHKISVNEFESKFLELFKNEDCLMPQTEFKILDELFADVDAYCGNSSLFDPRFDINEDQLRMSAFKALQELKQ